MQNIFHNLLRGTQIKFNSSKEIQAIAEESDSLLVSNTISVISISVLIITVIYLPYLYYKHPLTSHIVSLFHFNIMAMIVVLFLNSKKFFLTSSILFYFLECFFLSSTSIIMGRNTFFHIYLLTGFMVLPFMFTEKDKIIQITLYALFSICFIFLEFYFGQYSIESTMNAIGLCFLIFSFSFFTSKFLQSHRKKIELLLYNTLPKEIVDELKEHGRVEAKTYNNVVIILSDIVDFTRTSKNIKASILLEDLNSMFSTFDHIVEKYGGERIKTIGDAYMAVFGMHTHKNDLNKNLFRAVTVAQKMIRSINEIKFKGNKSWQIRVGVHSGEVIGGIIGEKNYIFDIFGDTVNTTSRLETNASPMSINVTNDNYNLIKDNFKGVFENKNFKGIGNIETISIETNLNIQDDTTIRFLKRKVS